MAAIDIRDHNEINLFENNELIEILGTTWPEFLEPYELKSIMSPTDSPSPIERKMLRRSGLSCFVTIGEKTYMGPGMGITKASTSTKVSITANNVRRFAKKLARVVSDLNSEFEVNVKSEKIDNPNFNLLALVVYLFALILNIYFLVRPKILKSDG